MKTVALVIAANIASIITAAGAVAIAYAGKPHWAWFLVVSILLHCGSIKFKSDEK